MNKHHDRNEFILDQWFAGETPGEIARIGWDRHGYTINNSIIAGLMHRSRAAGDSRATVRRIPGQVTSSIMANRRDKNYGDGKKPIPPRPQHGLREIATGLRPLANDTLLTLQPGCCKYPIGDLRRDGAFCARPAASLYCEAHTDIVRAKPTPRARSPRQAGRGFNF